MHIRAKLSEMIFLWCAKISKRKVDFFRHVKLSTDKVTLKLEIYWKLGINIKIYNTSKLGTEVFQFISNLKRFRGKKY